MTSCLLSSKTLPSENESTKNGKQSASKGSKFFPFTVAESIMSELPHPEKVYPFPLTLLYRMDSSASTLWTGLFPIEGVSDYFLSFPCLLKFM